MASESSSYNGSSYNGNDENLYAKYKLHEKTAFKSLFPNNNYRPWTLKHFYSMAAKVIPSFPKTQRQSIIADLEESTKAREKHSLRFSYGPRKLRHDKFVQLVNSIIDLLKAAAPRDAVSQEVETLGNDMTFDEADFLRFLEEIELLINKAVALWARAKAEEITLSTATMRLCFLSFIKTSCKGSPLSILTFLL